MHEPRCVAASPHTGPLIPTLNCVPFPPRPQDMLARRSRAEHPDDGVFPEDQVGACSMEGEPGARGARQAGYAVRSVAWPVRMLPPPQSAPFPPIQMNFPNNGKAINPALVPLKAARDKPRTWLVQSRSGSGRMASHVTRRATARGSTSIYAGVSQCSSGEFCGQLMYRSKPMSTGAMHNEDDCARAVVRGGKRSLACLIPTPDSVPFPPRPKDNLARQFRAEHPDDGVFPEDQVGRKGSGAQGSRSRLLSTVRSVCAPFRIRMLSASLQSTPIHPRSQPPMQMNFPNNGEAINPALVPLKAAARRRGYEEGQDVLVNFEGVWHPARLLEFNYRTERWVRR